MDEKIFQKYVYDLGLLVKEKALQAKMKKAESKDIPNQAYDLGFLMAMHEVVSLMQQQAESFGIDIKEIGLEGVDPERDLL